MSTSVKTALKRKNQLVGEIKELYELAIANNSIQVGNPRRYSVASLLVEADEKTLELVKLKAKIHVANMPVYSKIFELSELKNSIKQIEKISVEEGKQVGGFRQLEEIKEVEMNVLNKRSLLKAKKELVEILQEELDVHNVTTYID